jgi:serine/threonine protein kinase
MKTEALIGKELGTSRLQRLIGRGTQGTVYLAQQTRPHRQVAVKVFLRAAALEPAVLAEFLERFQREVDAASSLEHPNILSIHEYGEHDGLAYMVMPYMKGGTLRDVLERNNALPLAIVADYLEQLAAAVDFAHGKGIVHRDIKPGNILISSDGRLLLADFGLTNVVSEGKMAQVRLAGAGMLDYMAPEQVMGKKMDPRADLYSLGVVLYHMVTGTVPFKGETLTQVAVKHLQTPPQPPRSLRGDLPAAAEQVILRALAKRPGDRYEHAQDLASAFRLALHPANEVQIDNGQASAVGAHDLEDKSQSYRPRGLFDPQWQTGALTRLNNEQSQNTPTPAWPVDGAAGDRATTKVAPSKDGGTPQLRTVGGPSIGAHVAYKKHILRLENEQETEATSMPEAGKAAPSAPERMMPAFSTHSTWALSGVSNMQQSEAMSPVSPQLWSAGTASPNTEGHAPVGPVKHDPTSPLPSTGPTGALGPQNDAPGNTATIKLTGPARVVRVPVAGQPGQFVTGLLPVLPTSEPQTADKRKNSQQRNMKIIAVVLLIFLLAGSGTFWFAKTHGNQSNPANQARVHNKSVTNTQTPNISATATAQVKATAEVNIILSDPLDQNIHNWLVTTTGTQLYQFKDGAYHITNNDPVQGAPAILPNELLTGSFGYSLTMEEIKGNDNSINNAFGMILRATSQQKSGKTVTNFYSFEVANKQGGEYQFWKYDNGQRSNVNPWKELWHHPFGGEFHQGHGPKSINTFKISAKGKTFTLIVNGRRVGTVQDGSFTSGAVGMLVNQKGTEVAFSNLLLTKD